MTSDERNTLEWLATKELGQKSDSFSRALMEKIQGAVKWGLAELRVEELKREEAEGRAQVLVGQIANLEAVAERKAKATTPYPAPRYDAVFFEGTAALDALAHAPDEEPGK